MRCISGCASKSHAAATFGRLGVGPNVVIKVDSNQLDKRRRDISLLRALTQRLADMSERGGRVSVRPTLVFIEMSELIAFEISE